jgi:nicotinamide-nucleotide amidase
LSEATSPVSAAKLRRLARQCGVSLLDSQLRLASAESCTGGLVASTCTAIPGSSDWFECAFVTYRIAAKRRLLGVSDETLQRWGAVSEPTAKEMALGALRHCDADIAVSVTGVAGPSGGDVANPVGTVWFAWTTRGPNDLQVVQTARHIFLGNREQIRRGAVATALRGVLACLASA